MKSFKIALMALALVFVFGTVVKAESPAMKIAYVDLSKIFDEYNKTKEYDVAIEKKHGEMKQVYDGKLAKIKESEQKLALMKENEKAKLQSQIDKDKNDLTEYARQKQTDLKKERDEKIREILGDIEKTVREIADKDAYTLILNDKVLIYGNDSLNITAQVVKALNDKYPVKEGK